MARRRTGSGHSCLSRADCPRLWLDPHPLGSHIREPLVPAISQASAVLGDSSLYLVMLAYRDS